MKNPFDIISGVSALVLRAARWLQVRCRPALGIIAALSLSACSSPAVRVQYIETKTYIPIPAELTQPISIDLSNATWGSAVADLKAGLQTCDGQLQAIKDLKAPPKTP